MRTLCLFFTSSLRLAPSRRGYDRRLALVIALVIGRVILGSDFGRLPRRRHPRPRRAGARVLTHDTNDAICICCLLQASKPPRGPPGNCASPSKRVWQPARQARTANAANAIERSLSAPHRISTCLRVYLGQAAVVDTVGPQSRPSTDRGRFDWRAAPKILRLPSQPEATLNSRAWHTKTGTAATDRREQACTDLRYS